jgi:calcineurin-like phosphoesterase family protein
VSKVYFISDLHFGHKRITEFTCELGKKYRSGDTYLENMQNIITNWNKVVKKKDLVWVLGDTAFTQEGFDALGELAGRKKLVRGNHDDFFTTEEWLKHFETVESLVKYKQLWLSHCPIHPHELRGKRNAHGHVHHNSIKNSYTNEYDDRYINVCCEAIGETPISYADIMNGTYDKIRKC